MTGITLSAEQVRAAPPEVRRWIEQELTASLGFRTPIGEAQRSAPHLVGCSREEAAAILTLIEGVFPAVNVFFELGRKGLSCGQGRLEAYQLADIQHHTRLQNPEQVLTCLSLIDDALRRVRGSKDVSVFGTDGGYCFIATETQQSIRALWFELISEGDHAEAGQPDRPLSDAAADANGAAPPATAGLPGATARPSLG